MFCCFCTVGLCLAICLIDTYLHMVNEMRSVRIMIAAVVCWIQIFTKQGLLYAKPSEIVSNTVDNSL